MPNSMKLIFHIPVVLFLLESGFGLACVNGPINVKSSVLNAVSNIQLSCNRSFTELFFYGLLQVANVSGRT